VRNNRTEQKLLNLIREEYNNRLLQVFTESVQDLFEVDMVDEFGNTIITQGLKVRHKKSGYEYTVDHVEGKDDNMVVVLRSPESPRFKASPSNDVMAEGDETGDPSMERIKVDQVDVNKVMAKDSIEEFGLDDAVKQMDAVKMIKVPRKEFEKKYEVK
jgi:hypothetical protein